jgi:hypothetical protein
MLISEPMQELIDEHNARVEHIWLTVGSRCKPANEKRAAGATATLSELLMPEGEIGTSFGLRSDGSSSKLLTGSYVARSLYRDAS